jgi:acyl-CoA synthetase (AMP-forming)/AMP-acid ligase II
MPYKSRYTVEIPQCNILSYLFDNIRGDPNAPIWIDAKDNSNSLSRDQAFSLIQRLAVGFDRHGVGEGEAVMVFSPNHIFVPLVYLAAAGSKRFFTGANPAYTVNEVAYQMSTVKAALILIHPSLIEIGQAAARKANILPERLFLFADTQSTSPGELRDWRELLAPEADAARWRCDPLRGDEASKTIAAINFSSGTTGMPKGVCVTHHNLVANTAQTIFNFFESTPYSEDSHPAERWLAFLPLYHAYSQLWTINIACRLQVPVYVMSKFALEDFLQYIEKFQITTLQAVPPVLVMLNKREEAKKYSLASLRQILSGAAPLSLELQNEVSAKFDVVISQGWGMTETTCVGMLMPGRENDMTGKIYSYA